MVIFLYVWPTSRGSCLLNPELFSVNGNNFFVNILPLRMNPADNTTSNLSCLSSEKTLFIVSCEGIPLADKVSFSEIDPHFTKLLY